MYSNLERVMINYYVSYGAFSKTKKERSQTTLEADSAENVKILVKKQLHKQGFKRVNIYQVCPLEEHNRTMNFLRSVGAFG